MIGTDATTGKPLSGIAHLRQSVRDILTTLKGSRVMLPEYGSDLLRLVASPLNRAGLLAIYAETIGAIARWETRFRPIQVVATSASPGRVVLDVTGEYLPDGVVVTLNGIEVS